MESVVAMSIHSRVEMTGSVEPITNLRTKTSRRIGHPRELQHRVFGFKSNTMLYAAGSYTSFVKYAYHSWHIT